MRTTIRLSLLTVALCLSITSNAQTATLADPAYANMQRAVGGILQSATASRGYAATDPRTYATLRGVGTATATAVATASAGLLIAGTAPAWGTVLGMAALGGAVSYGVSVGIDAAVKWAFGPNQTTPIKVTGGNNPNASNGVTAGQPCFSVDLGPICGSSPQEVLTNVVLTTTVFTDITSIELSPEPNNSPAYANGRRYYTTTSGHRSDLPGGIYSNMNGYYIWQVNATTTCPPYFVQNGTHCVSSMIRQYFPTVNAETNIHAVSFTDALAQLTDSQKSAAVSYEAMALIINEMWKNAASQPGYAGAPYLATNPITASQVQAWAQANPEAYPKVQELAAPVATTSKGFYPSTTAIPSVPVSPASSTYSPTSTNPSTTPEVNLGPDPNTKLELPDAPTTDSIFKPFFDIVSPFVNLQYAAPPGQCPKPTFDFFGKSLLMDQHCTIFETFRGPIQTVMTAVFLVAAAIIVFTA